MANKQIDYGRCIDQGHDFVIVGEKWHCGDAFIELKCYYCEYTKTALVSSVLTPEKYKALFILKKDE